MEIYLSVIGILSAMGMLGVTVFVYREILGMATRMLTVLGEDNKALSRSEMGCEAETAIDPEATELLDEETHKKADEIYVSARAFLDLVWLYKDLTAAPDTYISSMCGYYEGLVCDLIRGKQKRVRRIAYEILKYECESERQALASSTVAPESMVEIDELDDGIQCGCIRSIDPMPHSNLEHYSEKRSR